MDKIQGNIDTLSSMQLTAAMEGLDAECKLLLSNREILAVILRNCAKINLLFWQYMV